MVGKAEDVDPSAAVVEVAADTGKRPGPVLDGVRADADLGTSCVRWWADYGTGQNPAQWPPSGLASPSHGTAGPLTRPLAATTVLQADSLALAAQAARGAGG